MKKLLLKKFVAFVAVGFLLFISNGYAQVDKGVTSTGKEVDCSTINPSVDKTVSEYGKIVMHPRVTSLASLSPVLWHNSVPIRTDLVAIAIGDRESKLKRSIPTDLFDDERKLISGDFSQVRPVANEYVASPGSNVFIEMQGLPSSFHYEIYTSETGNTLSNPDNPTSFKKTSKNLEYAYVQIMRDSLPIGSRIQIPVLFNQYDNMETDYNCDGKVLFFEDFGGNSPSDPDCSSTPNPNVVSAMTFASGIQPGSGQYGMVKHTTYGWALPGNTDHTYFGDLSRGYFMMIDPNTGMDNQPMYESTIDNLCTNAELAFSFWASDLQTGGERPLFDITLINPANNAVLVQSETWQPPRESQQVWTQYGVKYTLPEGISSVKFRISNRNNEYAGNDYCIDDIKVVYCNGEIVQNDELEVTKCANTNVQFSPTVPTVAAIPNPAYKWQHTNTPTDENSWQTIVSATESDYSIESCTLSDSGYYRMFMADASIIENVPQTTACVLQTLYNYHLIIYPEFTPGAISSTGQTINQGAEAATIGNVSSATGGNGNISYQWYEGTNAIEGATSASYKPGSAYTETIGVYTFTRKAKDETCSTTFTTSEGSYVLTTREPDHTVLGLTRTGKEVDCSTIDPSVDKTITEHGKIVTSPRVTRNGKIITEECSTCGIELSITDTVNCTSITLNAAITAGEPTAATLRVYSDAAHNTQVGSDITANITSDNISAVASNLNCHTRYYFVLEATEGTGTCTFDWADSTRDMTMEKVTTCTVGSVRALGIGTDLSHEHGYNGSTNQIDSVYDHEGNAYAVVQIGNQCWLKENMRCTTEPGDATNILQFPAQLNSNHAPKYAYYPNDNPDNYAKWGCLYNWPAAMNGSTTEGSRGICPEGWHVPTDGEWTTMLSLADVGVNSGENAGKLAGGCDWGGDNPASTGPSNYSYSDRNSSGFSAFPVGVYNGGVFFNVGNNTDFWCSTPSESNTAYGVYLYCSNNFVYRDTYDYIFGFSVRCVRNGEYVLSEIQIDTIECSSFSVYARMESGVAETFTATAFTDATCTTPVGLVTATTNAAKDSIFAEFVTLEANTSYYVRITASDNVRFDTSYATVTTRCKCRIHRLLEQDDNVNFTNYEWGHEKDGILYIDSVSDHEGNRYGVVQVGPQCWLAQNMRATTRPSTGEDIDVLTSTNTLVNNRNNAVRYPQVRWQTWITDSATRVKTGPLYNWPAQVDYGVETGNPDVPEWYENRRGICPKGWHIVDKNEWDKVLTPSLGGANELVVRACAGKVGTGTPTNDPFWKRYAGVNDKYPGAINNPMRNSSGLTFLPSGHWTSNGGFEQPGSVHLLAANQYSASEFHYFHFKPEQTTLATGQDPKDHGHNVRCIRDGAVTLSELVIDELTCNSAKFHAKFFNSGADTVVLNTVKAGASTSTEFIQNNKAATVRISNDTVYAEMSNLDCGKIYSFYIKVYDKEYESYAAVKDTIDRDATLSLSRPCTVTDVHSNEWSSAANQIDSVSDHEGNVYEVVQIGNQCWLRENMRCQSSPRPDVITNFTKGTRTQASATIPYYYISTNANSETVNYEKFGCLYNWAAAMDTTVGNVLLGFTGIRRGICPEGWHIPADAEWYELEKQVANKALTSEASRSDYSASFDAGRLAAGCDWGAINNSILRPQCYNHPDRNSTLFSALPAGVRDANGFELVNIEADFWSSTEAAATTVYRRLLRNGYNGISRKAENKTTFGFSVRCVRDVETTVADIQISKVTCSSVNVATKMQTGIVTNTVNVLVSTQSNFSDTVDVKTLTIPADSILSTDFYDLKTNTTYYVKIADKTANFTTQLCACEVLQARADNEHVVDGKVYEVQDVDGNWYGVVQIGGQCWLRENMRCTTSPKTGDRIVTNNYYSTISRSAKWYANDSTTYAKYGLLYNACAALDVTRNATDPAVAASNSTTGWAFTTDTLVQGICPTGWHLPTDTEWTRMENYIVTDGHYNLSLAPSPAFGSQNNGTFPSDNAREGTNTPVSPMLAYLDTWTASNTIRATASADTNRNKVQFEAKAAGYFPYNSNTNTNIGIYGAFWTATPTGNNMFIRQMHNTAVGVSRLNVAKSVDISVRCVRDVIYPEFTTCTDTINGTITLTTAKYTKKVEVFNSSDELVRTKYNTVAYSEFSKLPTGRYVVKATSKSGHSITDTVDVKFTPTYCSVARINSSNESGNGTRLDSVKDHQGNNYLVVQIGDQCWLRENMRATTLPSGRTMGVCTENGHTELNSPSVGPTYFLNQTSNGHVDFYEKYGCMYNWIAIMDTTSNVNNTQISITYPHRGICPQGWHVPEISEFATMFNYVVSDNHYGVNVVPNPAFDYATHIDKYVGTNTPIAAMLAGGCDWTPSADDKMAGSDGQYKNATKLSIFPARSWTGSTAAFDAIGGYGGLWSSTQTPEMTSSSGLKSDPAVDVLYYHIAATANAGAFRMGFMDKYGLAQPVRCVRDLLIPKVVLCGECTDESIQLKAVVNVDSCALLNSSKTFVASKLHPEVDSKFTGLQPGKYYVVSTSSTGNVSIDSVTILTKVHTTCSGTAHEGTVISTGVYADKEWSSAPNVIDSVSDHQGNVYKVVQIGNQCWLKENMRTSQTNTGTDLTNKTGTTNKSTTDKYYYVSDKADKYGYLYNYPAANSICPSGWHLPSDAEWKNMVEAAGVTDNNTTTGTGLGRLVTGCDWQSVIGNPTDPKPGNYEYAERNLSGFSALPAGEWNDDFYAAGNAAEFWTATTNSSGAWYRAFGYSDNGTHKYSYDRHRAYSVRCVRDN